MKQAELIIHRLKEAARVKTDTQLAALLDIGQSNVSQARIKNRVPENWILKVAMVAGVNPNELVGPDFASKPKPQPLSYPEFTDRLQELVRRFVLEDIEVELESFLFKKSEGGSMQIRLYYQNDYRAREDTRSSTVHEGLKSYNDKEEQ